jgi:hypothetical protein
MKVNVYLIYPNNIYHEFILKNDEKISNIIRHLYRVYPETRYNYELKNEITDVENETKIINMDTNEEINTSHTYEGAGLGDECNIKVYLKIIKKTS